MCKAYWALFARCGSQVVLFGGTIACRSLGWLALVVLIASGTVRLEAQVVQLPTWRYFGVDTSVLVPDRGTAMLGGVNYASDARMMRRPPLLPLAPFASASGAHTTGGQTVSVSATIIDHQQIDQALLAEARAMRVDSAPPDPLAQQAAWLSQHVHRTRTDGDGRQSVLQLNRQAQQREVARVDRLNEQAAEFLAHGDACGQRGEYAAARIFYRNAWKQAQGTVKQLAAQRLAELPRSRRH